MIYINVKKDLWKKYSENKFNLWVKGYIYSHNINFIIEKFKKIEKNEIESFVKNIQGHFALIVQTEKFTFIATDKIRSTPLFFVKRKNFGVVWGDDIPINKKKITTKWLIPLRSTCKIPFSFFGKKGKKTWKQFDINFFYYF